MFALCDLKLKWYIIIIVMQKLNINVTECIVCVLGHDPLTFSFLSFSFWLGGNFLAPII